MSFEEFKMFVINNGVTITLVILVLAVLYINYKINDLNYRVQQTLMYTPPSYNQNRISPLYQGFW